MTGHYEFVALSTLTKRVTSLPVPVQALPSARCKQNRST